MDMKRFGLTCFVVFLSLVVLVVIQHYAAMHLGYLENLSIHISDFLSMAIFSILFCFLFVKMRSQSVGDGIMYGIILFLFISTIIANNNLSTFFALTAKNYFWTLGTLAQFIILGAVAGLIQRCRSCS